MIGSAVSGTKHPRGEADIWGKGPQLVKLTNSLLALRSGLTPGRARDVMLEMESGLAALRSDTLPTTYIFGSLQQPKWDFSVVVLTLFR